MRHEELIDIAESINKPIVNVSPSQRRLGGLHRENEID